MDQQQMQEMEALISKAVQASLENTLITNGFDLSDPIAMQRLMVAMREITQIMADPEYQRDLAYIRKWRLSMEQITSVTLKTAVAMILTSLGTIIVLGVKHFFTTKP